MKAAKVPMLAFHGMRHSHATAMLEANVPIKIASQRLGHASIGINRRPVPARDESDGR